MPYRTSQLVVSHISHSGGLLHELKRRQLKKVLQKVLVRAEKYENYQETFDGHNSFSKNNPDANFMRMKEEYIVVNSKQVMAVKRTS